MEFFFSPSSIAVVGASDKGPGSFLLDNVMTGFQGDIYPVNPNYDCLRGIPCYPSIVDIPGDVELALLLIPAKAAPEAIKACVGKGVKGVIIQSAGFSEVGERGEELSRQCRSIAREGGLRIWGPNCMGMLDVPKKLFLTMMQPAITSVVELPGRISLVVQSGMLSAGFLADLMSRHSIGVSKVCSLGNKLDVDECDVLEYLLADPGTSVVALYLESFARGRRFIEIASKSTKPIVLLKGGISQAGAKAALSHTASLAGDARVMENMLAASGVVQARDFHQMMDLALSLSHFPALPPGSRVGIISFSGGAGILTCDLLEENGLRVAELSPSTIESLSEIFPPWMPPSNPVDLFPAMARMGRVPALENAFDKIIDDPAVDAVVFHHLIGVESKEIDLEALGDKARKKGKAVFFWGLGFSDGVAAFRKGAHNHGIPVFTELARTVECLSKTAEWKAPDLTNRIAGINLPSPTLSGETQILDEYESKRFLEDAGVPVVRESLAATLDGCLEAAGEIGYPVVLKGLMPDVVHKSEFNMVRLNLDGPERLKRAAEGILKDLDGKGRLLVQKQVKGDFELILGFLHDAQFGPLVMVGLGGIMAELNPDVVFCPAPMNQTQALALLDRIKSQKLLNGFRGMTPMCRETMADLVVAIGKACIDNNSIRQLDMNPVIISDGLPVAVDASIILER